MAASNSIASSTPDQRQLRLIAASAQGNEARIRDILAEEPAWTSNADRDALRQSLQKLATRGNLELARLLLAHGADPDASPRRDNEIPAILKAAEGGHAAVITELLAHGADPNWSKPSTGQTALFAACIRGRDEAVKALLEGGAAVDARDRESRTPLLFLASEKKNAKWTAETLRLLVEVGRADIEARDHIGRTALIWSATTGNLTLTDLLLSGSLGGKVADTSAANNRGRTALHLAAEQNHEAMVRLLLERGAEPSAASDGGWTALHNAAQSGHTAVIALLLEHGADVNAELNNGMTPLHWASFNGHEDAVRLLLTRPEADLSAKDSFHRTPMLCAAEKFNRDIVQLLSPARAADRLSPVAQAACRSFEATIVDFGDFRDGKKQLVFKPSVHELLYGWDEEHNKPTHPTMTKNIKYQPNFRWIHLPANNLAWVETLIAKSFIESGHRDIEAFKSLERCFDQEHCGPLAHAHFMRTFAQRIPSSQHSPQREERTLDSVTEGTQSPSIGTERTSSELSPRPAGADLKPLPGARTPSRTDMMAAADADAEPSSKKKSKAEQIVERHGKTAKRAKGPPGNPPGFKKRNSSQSGSSSPMPAPWENAKVAAPSGRLVLFMPFLHYETNERRKKMSEAIERTRSGRGALPDSPSRDQLLVDAYLSGVPRLHPRRTLDQFFYHGIDTAMRDEDQVVYRFCKLHGDELKVFMVDQLWLWVIGRDLVITCFPQRWAQPRQDPLNMLEGIIEETNAKTRPPVQTVYDLAMLISSRCAGLFDRHRMDDQQYQFLDMFESSIGRVTNRESELFVRFNRASELSGRLRRELLKRGRRPWAKSKGGRRRKGTTTDDCAGDKSGGDPADELLDIGSETELLAEIKDILDELHIIDTVLHSQSTILAEFELAVTDEVRASVLDPLVARRAVDPFVAEIRRRAAEQKRLLGTHHDDIQRMVRQAESIYTSLTHLLDLKQKHSNALEARFARDQAEIAGRQGQTVMVFTLVTIVFLPMSFVASFFAINLEEWGDGRLTVGYVARYMFSIGLGISIPLVVLAFMVDDIADLAHRIFGRGRDQLATFRRWRRRRRRRRSRSASRRRNGGEDNGTGKDSESSDDDDDSGDYLSRHKTAEAPPRLSTTSRAPRRSLADERNGSAWPPRTHTGYGGASSPLSAHQHIPQHMQAPPRRPMSPLRTRPPGVAPRKFSVGSGGGVSWADGPSPSSPDREKGKEVVAGSPPRAGGRIRLDDDLEKGRVSPVGRDHRLGEGLGLGANQILKRGR